MEPYLFHILMENEYIYIQMFNVTTTNDDSDYFEDFTQASKWQNYADVYSVG